MPEVRLENIAASACPESPSGGGASQTPLRRL